MLIRLPITVLDFTNSSAAEAVDPSLAGPKHIGRNSSVSHANLDFSK